MAGPADKTVDGKTNRKNEKRTNDTETTRFQRGGKEMFEMARKRSRVANSNDFLFRQPKEESKEGKHKTVAEKREEKRNLKSKIKENDVMDQSKDKGRAITTLSFTRMKPGMMLLGYVKDVMRRSLLIGLPFNLSGIVSVTETSDVFNTLGESEEGKAALEEVDLNLLYQKNQRVVVVVTNLRTENNVKIIELSMRPSLLNPIPGSANERQCLQPNGIVQGEVTQKEDYGYAINLGFAELSGFFKCDTTATDLPLGSVRLFSVASIDRVVQLETPTGQRAVEYPGDGALAAVRPGCMLKTAVTSVAPGGVHVSSRGLSGEVVYYHLKERSVQSLRVGSKLKLRVVCVCANTRQVFLSEARTVENLAFVPPLPAIGAIHEDGVVANVEKTAVLLAPNVLVPQVRMSDGKASGEALFSVGQEKVVYRVLGYDLIDDLVLAGTAESILRSEIVAVESAVPGQFVTATVTAAGEQAVQLAIGTHIRGVLYPEHMGELATVKDPRKAFPVGKKLRVRVVNVLPHQHTLICTNKRSLLREDAPVVCDLQQVKQGDEVVGVVKELRDSGVFFRFFNQITAFLPVIELQRRNLRAEDLFKPGRVAHVKVNSIDLARNRMVVVPAEGSVDAARELSGKVLSGVVVKTDVHVAVYGKEAERGVVLHLEDDMYAFLPEKQISDHPDLNGRLLRLFTEGSRINELGVLDIIPKGRYNGFPLWLATTQSVLVRCMKEGTMVRSVASMEKGKCYFGYVCALNASGAYVRFLGYERLFVPRSQLATKMPEKVTDVVSEGQSVCVVRSNDVGSLRCEVEGDAQALFVASYQSERLRLLDSGNYEGEEEANVEVEGSEMEEEEKESEDENKEDNDNEEDDEDNENEEDDEDNDNENNAQNSEDESEEEVIESEDTSSASEDMEEEEAPFDWRKCPLGSVLKGTIKSLRPYGALVELENGLLGFAQSPLHTEGVTLEEGAEVTARVLDVNPSLELFDVTLNAKFLSLPQEEVRQRSRKMSDCSFGMSAGQRVEATVLLKKEKYFVAAMPSHNNDLVFVSFDSYNSVHTAIADLEPGATVSCVLVTEAGLSDLVVKEMNAFKGKLEEDEEERVRAFFGAVRGACVYNEIAQHEVLTRAINQGQVIKLNEQFCGQTVSVRVKKVTAGYLNVVLLRVRCEGVYQANILNVDTDRDPLHAFDDVKEGDILSAKVVFMDAIREKKKNAEKTDAPSGRMSRLFLSTKQADLALPVGEWVPRKTYKDFTIGSTVQCVVEMATNECLRVILATGVMGEIWPNDFDPSLTEFDVSAVPPGTSLEMTIANELPFHFGYGLSRHPQCMEPVQHGTRLPALVISKPQTDDSKEQPAIVRLPGHRNAVLYCTDVLEPSQWKENPLSTLPERQITEVTVIDQDPRFKREERFAVTLRQDAAALADPSFERGELVYGFVSSRNERGVFVRLSYRVVAYVAVGHLSDGYTPAVGKKYHPGLLVTGRLLQAVPEKFFYELSLKKSDIEKKTELTWKNLEEGMTVQAVVTAVKEEFVRLQIDCSKLSGVAFRENCADTPEPELAKLYAVGDKVKARVLDFDKSQRRIHFALKPSLLPQEEDEDVPVIASDDEDVPVALDDVSDASDSDAESPAPVAAAPLGSFGWEPLGGAAETPSAAAQPSKKPAKLSEREVEARERSLAEGAAPTSEAEFERLLVARPTESLAWLQYAAWLLSLTEVAKARAVLRRGLKTMPVHLETERGNLWLALLNLEAEYGDEESLQTLYAEVRQKMDDKTAALHMAGIYEGKKQWAEAYNVWKQLAKEHKEDVSVWTGWCTFYFKQGDFAKSGDVLKRALEVLPKAEKSQMLTSYGVLLYKYDRCDQGRTVFEDLLSKLPKRLDLWNVYVDQETKLGHFDFVRSLFKRMVELKVNVNKIKGIFKKWLVFEDAHGNETTVKEVEEMVQDYITRLSS